MNLISAREAWELLGIPASTLRTWVQRGQVKRCGWGKYSLDDVRKCWLTRESRLPDEKVV